jgi:hypothetical protein
MSTSEELGEAMLAADSAYDEEADKHLPVSFSEAAAGEPYTAAALERLKILRDVRDAARKAFWDSLPKT